MSVSYGPWAISIHVGSTPQLNAFWKKRLAMLPVLDSRRRRITGPVRLVLICVVVLVVGLPTLRSGAADTQQPATDSGAAAQHAGSQSDPSGQESEEKDVDRETFTIKGAVLSPMKKPVVGADVRVYESFTWTEKLFAQTKTDEHGRFQFAAVPKDREGRWYCKVTVSAPPFASRVLMTSAVPSRDVLNYQELVLSEAESIRGWVIGADQKPVSGVVVYTPPFKAPVPGVQSAETNEDGYFEIDDVAAWDRAAEEAASLERYGELQSWGGGRALRLRHPDYGAVITAYSQVPTSVFVRFERPMIVTGRLLYSGEHNPAAGLQVTSVDAYGPATTDEKGRFRLVMQPAERNKLGLVGGELRGRTYFSGIPGAKIELPDLSTPRTDK